MYLFCVFILQTINKAKCKYELISVHICKSKCQELHTDLWLGRFQSCLTRRTGGSLLMDVPGNNSDSEGKADHIFII